MFRGDVFAHHQEHLTAFTASDIVHRYCCRLVSHGWDGKAVSVPSHQWHQPAATSVDNIRSCKYTTVRGNNHQPGSNRWNASSKDQLHAAQAFLKTLISTPTPPRPLRNSPHFIKPWSSLPCSLRPATDPYPELNKSSQYPPISLTFWRRNYFFNFSTLCI